MIVFPNAKLNLGLNIIRKRDDGFHDLETVFYPLSIYDALEINTRNSGSKIHFSSSGNDIDTPADQNICLKACHLLKKDFPDLPPVSIHLHKNIPIGAGLGGGSADGAFTLLLLNKKFKLGLSQEQLVDYALKLGSDCPFFIINKPCLARGRGEIMTEIALDLSAYHLVVINPGIHISTANAFKDIIPSQKENVVKDLITKPVTEWKNLLCNDFENAVFKQFPEIDSIKKLLYDKGAVYASMSGSGSTVYGIFEKKNFLQENLAQYSFPAHYFIKIIS